MSDSHSGGKSLGRRLPTVGAAPASGDEALLPPDERRAAPLPLVAIASAVPTAAAIPFACRLADALAGEGACAALLRVQRGQGAGSVRVVRERDGAVPPDAADDPLLRQLSSAVAPVVRVEAGVAHLRARLDEAFDRMPRGAHVLAVGNDVPALYETRLTVMITAGVAPPAWSPSGRGIRDQVDVELADPRPGVAEGLAAALARR